MRASWPAIGGRPFQSKLTTSISMPGTRRRKAAMSASSLVTWRVPEVVPVPALRDITLTRTGSSGPGRWGGWASTRARVRSAKARTKPSGPERQRSARPGTSML